MSILELEPVDFYCGECDSAMEWTGCGARFCDGYRCMNCGRGCDISIDDGFCGKDLQSIPFQLANELREERRAYGRPRLITNGRVPGECS